MLGSTTYWSSAWNMPSITLGFIIYELIRISIVCTANTINLFFCIRTWHFILLAWVTPFDLTERFVTTMFATFFSTLEPLPTVLF